MATDRNRSDLQQLSDTLWNVLNSPNVMDSNGEMANIVDAVSSIARAINHSTKWLGNSEEGDDIGALKEHAETTAAAMKAAARIQAAGVVEAARIQAAGAFEAADRITQALYCLAGVQEDAAKRAAKKEAK